MQPDLCIAFLVDSDSHFNIALTYVIAVTSHFRLVA